MEDALEIHAYYTKMFEAFAMLPADDISSALFEHACYLWAKKPWREFGKFLDRIEAYADASQLSQVRKETIARFLAKQKPHFERCCWLVEERPYVTAADEPDLQRRRIDVLHRRVWIEFELVDGKDSTALTAHFERVRTEVDHRLALLTSQREQAAAPEHRVFQLRWDEFRNIVNISYSTEEDDSLIRVYNAAAPPADACSGDLWCPVLTNGLPFEEWLNYPAPKREAIRLGFMRGLCNLIGLAPPATLADWRKVREEICQPAIYGRCLNPITGKAEETGQYGEGQKKIEQLLQRVYDAGQRVPYHPNFDTAFCTQLENTSLSDVDTFLAAFSERYCLSTPGGYTHLLALVTAAEQTISHTNPVLVERAKAWLGPKIPQVDNGMCSPSAKNTRNIEKSIAQVKLINNQEIKQILINEVELGKTYVKPSNWGAAFRALIESDVLKYQNATAVGRWAISQDYITESAAQTVRKACAEGSPSTREQFRNDDDRLVFTEVTKHVKKLLTKKQINSTK